MLAGEGLGGVFQALLAVAGVDGGSTYQICIIDLLVLKYDFSPVEYGTAIGCPGNTFCG
jgi:hypothetical protein